MHRNGPPTDDDVHRRGLDALARELGPADMARFLHQVRSTAGRETVPNNHERPQPEPAHIGNVNGSTPTSNEHVACAAGPTPETRTAGPDLTNVDHSSRSESSGNDASPQQPGPMMDGRVHPGKTASSTHLVARCLSSGGFVLCGSVAAVALLLLALLLPQIPRQRTIQAVEAAGGEVYFAESIPGWLYDLCGERIEYLESATEIHLDGTGVDDRFVQRLRLLNSAGVVWLNAAKVTDQGAMTLLDFPSITSLDLGDTAVTEASLVPLLRHHRQLDTIWLQGTATGDAALEALAGTVTLRDLDLGRTQISDQGLAHLAKLPILHEIDLSDTAVGDAGIAHLDACASLASLILVRTQLTDAGLKHLARLPALEGLNLRGTPIQGSGLKFLTSARHLTSLNLDDTPLGDDGLEYLAGIRSLTFLTLTGTHVTDAGLAKLAGAKQLSQLYLGGTQTTPEGIQRLKEELPDCSIDLTGDGVEQLLFPH